jgi:aspartate-semialdehyde dehydrogenase
MPKLPPRSSCSTGCSYGQFAIFRRHSTPTKIIWFKKGFLVCNSNCAVIGIVQPFAALQKELGEVDQVSAVTMQAVSGAGYPRASSIDILDNIVAYKSGEEDKLETEAQKILGKVNGDVSGFLNQSDLKVSAACNRVPFGWTHSLRFTAFQEQKWSKAVRGGSQECIERIFRLGTKVGMSVLST